MPFGVELVEPLVSGMFSFNFEPLGMLSFRLPLVFVRREGLFDRSRPLFLRAKFTFLVDRPTGDVALLAILCRGGGEDEVVVNSRDLALVHDFRRKFLFSSFFFKLDNFFADFVALTGRRREGGVLGGESLGVEDTGLGALFNNFVLLSASRFCLSIFFNLSASCLFVSLSSPFFWDKISTFSDISLSFLSNSLIIFSFSSN
mmetsp:Transcript_12664/g.18964  ORF Transcript_12664/g.18964 Transcript_12664/m.18964 type:complete len:202 (-) Transcript_12664:1899-2504(-)